jgi:hypothetical protein
MRVVPANGFRRGPVVRRHHIVDRRRDGGSTSPALQDASADSA